MWPVSTWADPNPPCVPPPTLPWAVAINLDTVLILLSVCLFVCQSVSSCRPWPGWRVMSGLVTNGVARDVTTCHAATWHAAVCSPLSDCVGRREMAARPWQWNFHGASGAPGTSTTQPSRASAPRIDLSNRRQMSGRAERRWCDDTEPLQPLLLFICSRQRDAATAGVSGPSYPRHSYDPFCAITGYTVVTLPIIAFLPQPAPTQPQPRPRAHGDTGAISCRHCKLQTSPSPCCLLRCGKPKSKLNLPFTAPYITPSNWSSNKPRYPTISITTAGLGYKIRSPLPRASPLTLCTNLSFSFSFVSFPALASHLSVSSHMWPGWGSEAGDCCVCKHISFIILTPAL